MARLITEDKEQGFCNKCYGRVPAEDLVSKVLVFTKGKEGSKVQGVCKSCKTKYPNLGALV